MLRLRRYGIGDECVKFWIGASLSQQLLWRSYASIQPFAGRERGPRGHAISYPWKDSARGLCHRIWCVASRECVRERRSRGLSRAVAFAIDQGINFFDV